MTRPIKFAGRRCKESDPYEASVDRVLAEKPVGQLRVRCRPRGDSFGDFAELDGNILGCIAHGLIVPFVPISVNVLNFIHLFLFFWTLWQLPINYKTH